MRIAKILFPKAAILGLLTTQAFAHPGDLDLTYASGGIATTTPPMVMASGCISGPIAIDHDSRSISVGSLGSSAYIHVKDNTGSVDTSFGSSGFVATDFGGTTSRIVGLAIDDHNRIVVAGDSFGLKGFITVARFLPNGTLDTSFGSGGTSAISRPSSLSPGGLTIGKHGDIYVVGSTDDGADTLMSIAKMDDTGVLDSGFGSSGISVLHLLPSPESTQGTAITLDDIGNVYATGYTLESSAPYSFFNITTKLDPTGKLDSSFGGGKGFVQTDAFPAITTYHYTFSQSIALDSAGRIVVAGGAGDYDHTSGHSSFSAIRYLADGSLDTTFNGTGIFLSPQINGNQQASQVLVDGRGTTILTGPFSLDGSTSHAQIAAMRVTDSGCWTQGSEFPAQFCSTATPGAATVH